MPNKPDYKRATNTAYEILNAYNDEFPVTDVHGIIESFDYISIHTYSEISSKLNMNVYDYLYKCAPSNHGYTISDKKGHFIIAYNDLKDEPTMRFTLAHELGHIILDHDGKHEYQEKEADCFARNILCPVQIIKEFGISTTSDYVNCFEISHPMADVAIKYFSSDFYYISKHNYETLDEKIYCHFSGYSIAEIYA